MPVALGIPAWKNVVSSNAQRRVTLTLVVSAIVPDGIVIGVDSLSTTSGIMNMKVAGKFNCKSCGTVNDVNQVQIPPLQFPVSTKPYAEKLFKFKDRFAIACFGNAFVNHKSMQSQIRELEKGTDPISNVDVLADKLLYHFEKELKQEIKDLSKIPPGAIPFGFQVAGFGVDGESKVVALQVGQKPEKQPMSKGVVFSGDTALVQKLLEATGKTPQLQPNLPSFSLWDAVEFVEFLIKFVGDFQRFANMIPTVGGEIDIALVTSYSGFKWIKQKAISKILEG
jgi:hypothetical protein